MKVQKALAKADRIVQKAVDEALASDIKAEAKAAEAQATPADEPAAEEPAAPKADA